MNDQLIPAIRSTGVAVINPWEASADNKAMIAHAKSMRNLDKRRKAWQNAVLSLGSANAESIKKADGIVAVLDGVDVDSGTAAEIGYAAAMGKWVIGYQGDFRRTGEDETSKVNLQVEYFIRSRGGVVVHDLSSLTTFYRKSEV